MIWRGNRIHEEICWRGPALAWAAVTFCGLAGLAALTGCGMPGAPQAPSLKLPEPVEDLSAVRAGQTVTLRWTSPKKTTDHLLIKGNIPVQICWRPGKASCQTAGQTTVVPGAPGEFSAAMPAELTSGDAHAVSYFVELKSPRGRSAGLSNGAPILAGAAPAAVTGLAAEVRADGVALHWHGVDTTPVQLHRRLLEDAASAAEKKTKEQGKANSGKGGLTAPSPEPPERDLLVEAASGAMVDGALDASARFGSRYDYSAQRVNRVTLKDGKTLELAGEESAPVRADVVDNFPPAVPKELVAVAAAAEKTIDLSWQPDTESDLAGYIVYRIGSGDAADGSGVSDWMRISGPQPVATAAYRDTAVEPGHTYRYSVSAIDLLGHESKRSAEARESLPNP
jgi:hypothetical protein